MTDAEALDMDALFATRIHQNSTAQVTTHDGITISITWHHQWHRPAGNNSWHVENGIQAKITPMFGAMNPLTDNMVSVGRQWPYAWMADWTSGREYPTVINGIDDDELEKAIGLLVDAARAQRAHAAVRQQRIDKTLELLTSAASALASAREAQAQDRISGTLMLATTRATADLERTVFRSVQDGLLPYDRIAAAAGVEVFFVEQQAWHTDGSVPPQYYLSEEGFARVTGLTSNTISSYKSRGQLPEPDIKLGGSPGWHLLTVEHFMATRRGQGARTDLKATISQ